MKHDFILLDRSGSMGGQWIEVLNSINAYVKKLADDKVDTGVTLMTFDTADKPIFDVVRDRIIPSTWKEIASPEITPRGTTPLNDAVAQIVGLANKGINGQQYDNVSIVIVTDGYENASQELPGEPGRLKAKAMLDDCRQKGWAVTFLGANFDNVQQAAGYGTSLRATVNSSPKNLAQTMGAMASKRGVYASTGDTATMDWLPTEQEEAKKQ